jgi:N-acyl homoserine lactone hydrolase
MSRTGKLSFRLSFRLSYGPGDLLAAAALLIVVVAGAVVGGGASARPQAATHAQPPSTLRLYVFDCGVIKGLDPGLFGFKKEDVATTEMAVPCYLVVHPKGTLMWDVGAIPDTAFTSDNTPVTQGYFTSTRTLKSQLAQIGYAPSDITYLAHSHYHLDHIANSNEFANSTWLVRKVERDAMFAEKPPALVNPALYNGLKTSKTIILTTDEYDVFGDGTVIIKSAPGHTPGHQVLVLKFKNTGNVVVAGDLYHFPQERFSDHVPTFEYSKSESLASRAMIEGYIKQIHAQLWIEHDFVANSKLKKSPDYYD